MPPKVSNLKRSSFPNEQEDRIGDENEADESFKEASEVISNTTRKKRGSLIGNRAHQQSCICGDKNCADLMIEIGEIDPNRCGYISVPNFLEAKQRSDGQKVLLSDQIRVNILKCFNLKEDFFHGANAEKNFFVALSHYHPILVKELFTLDADDPTIGEEEKMQRHSSSSSFSVLSDNNDLAVPSSVRQRRKKSFPKTIDLELAQRVSLDSLEFMELDKDRKHTGKFIFAPNYSKWNLRDEISRRNFSAQSSWITASNSSSSFRCAADSLRTIQMTQSEAKTSKMVSTLHPDALAVGLQQMNMENAQLRLDNSALKAKNIQLDDKMNCILRSHVAEVSLTRFSIFSSAYHKAHPHAAHYLFGIADTWEETQSFMFAVFGVECPIDLFYASPSDLSAALDKQTPPLSRFEELLMTKFRMRRRVDLELLGLIFRKSATLLGRIFLHNVENWGELGLDLTTLPLPEEYMEKDLPDLFKEGNPEFKLVRALVDGKDFLAETIRTNSKMGRAQYSSKMHASAFRVMHWQSPSGLSHDHSYVYLANASETALVEFCGKHSEKKSPKAEFKADEAGVLKPVLMQPLINAPGCYRGGDDAFSPENVAKQCATEFYDSYFGNSEEPVISERTEEEYEEVMPDVGGGPPQHAGDENDDEDGLLEQMAELEMGGSGDAHLHLASSALANFRERLTNNIAGAPALSYDKLNERNEKMMEEEGPDANAAAKMRQLYRFEKLHELYESGHLAPCSLSYYLYETVAFRAAMLDYYHNPACIHEVLHPTRLAKYPPGTLILADRGFYLHTMLYTNMNGHITPYFMAGRSQFTADESLADLLACRLRYTNEVGFARVTQEGMLRDTIAYEYFPVIHHVVNWAFANVNLSAPLRNPAGYCDYLEHLVK